MPGEEHVPQNEMHVFDVASKAGVRMKVDRFKDQSISIATKPQRPGTGGGRGGGGGGNNNQTPQIPAEWLSDSNGKLYLTRQSRDLHRLDVCLADPATGGDHDRVTDRKPEPRALADRLGGEERVEDPGLML